MNYLDKIFSISGISSVLAAPHFQLEQAEFYSQWALRAMDLGILSPALIQLAIISPDESPDQITRLVNQMLLELEIAGISREQATAFVILEKLRALPNDVQSCWTTLQKLRLLESFSEAVVPVLKDLETIDLELGRAGEEGAVFETVAVGIDNFKRAAKTFVERSVIRLEKASDGRMVVVVMLAPSLT